MIAKYLLKKPKIAESAFVASNASIIGAVTIGKFSSLWFNVIARADINTIKIGAYTNVQDGSILHVDDDLGVDIGDYVTIGHGALIHGCVIGDRSLIGMGAIILNGASIGQGVIVAAGSLVCEGFKVPDNTLVMGTPARVKRELTAKERGENIYWAKKYAALAKEYTNRRR